MQIPDNVRPYLDVLVKHHFWLLALVVPPLVVPAVLLATGNLGRQIEGLRGVIDGKLSSLRTVHQTADHPNEKWAETLRRDAARVKRDTFVQWQRFYEEQAPMRVWPQSLGADFVERVSKLQPGQRLPRSLLERYHNGVRAIVRTLPSRMGANEEMRADNANDPQSQPFGRVQMATGGPRPVIVWSPADQKRVYESFNWQLPPTTTQVQLAQEEIWLYEMLCDLIGSMNAKATGFYDAAVTLVDELAVGYPAAEEKPGGVGEARIVRVSKAAAGPAIEEMPPGEGGAAAGTGPLVRPPHPRFSGGQGGDGGGFGGPPTPPAEGEPATPTVSPDDKFRNWIYVDFDGRPLMAGDLTASIAYRMIHLVPFRMRMTMDQRRLDDLLLKLASSKIPIDVRQVRMNPGAVGTAGFEGGPGFAPGTSERRRYDATVELRGSIALAAPPDRKAILGDAVSEEPESGEPAKTQQPPAEPASEPPATQESAEPSGPAAAPAPADAASVDTVRREGS